MIDVGRTSTEGNIIHKQVGLGCMRELPEHWTLTAQESRPGDSVFPSFYLQFVTSVSTLSSQYDGL